MNNAQWWKDELFRETSRLREAVEYESVDKLVARRSPFIERFAFVTAYEMRKLREAEELTQEVLQRGWHVRAFPCVVAPPHRRWFQVSRDRHHWYPPLEQHYDLDAPRAHTLSFFQLCDALIHHFAFDVRLTLPDGGAELLFTSDHKRNTELYGIPLDAYRDRVLDVAYDEVRWVDMDPSRKGSEVIQRRGRPAS
jgi:hypothetical protein